jgi:PPP family 3-phenylpropionic acid transporter
MQRSVHAFLLLSSYWFAITAALGIYFPYFSLYLTDSLGFTGTQAGAAFAIAPLVGMFAQPLWGQLADRSGSRTRVLTWLSAGTACGYALLGLPRSFAGVIAATALLSFFWTALPPVAIAVSLAAIEKEGGRVPFGRVRVWGTLGFFATVVGVPPALRALAHAFGQSERASFHLLFAGSAVFAVISTWLARKLPRPEVHERVRAAPGDLRWLASHGPYLRVLAVNFATYVFLQGPMVLFPVFIRSRGGDAATVSRMWIFMLCTETLLMLTAAAAYRKLGARRAIALGVFAWGLRWFLCAFCHELFWLYPVQLLHGVMVVSLQVGAPLLVQTLVPARLRATGQAGFNLFGSGLGGVVSSMLAGVVVDAYGIDRAMAVAGCAGIALGVCAPWLLPRQSA